MIFIKIFLNTDRQQNWSTSWLHLLKHLMLYELQRRIYSQLCLFWDIIKEIVHSLWSRRTWLILIHSDKYFRAWFWRKKCQFEILVIGIDSMCGDPISDLLYLAIPTALLGIGAFFFVMGKDNRKKIEEIFR